MLWTAFNSSIPVQRSLRLALSLTGAAALALASSPIQRVAAQEEDSNADDLGVMSISLKDVAKPTIGFQGALQGAGTPNQACIGGSLPIAVGENSVFFIDALANRQKHSQLSPALTKLIFQNSSLSIAISVQTLSINQGITYSRSLTLNRSNYLYRDGINRLVRDTLVTAIKHHPSIPTILLASIGNIKHLKQSRHT